MHLENHHQCFDFEKVKGFRVNSIMAAVKASDSVLVRRIHL